MCSGFDCTLERSLTMSDREEFEKMKKYVELKGWVIVKEYPSLASIDLEIDGHKAEIALCNNGKEFYYHVFGLQGA
jgi:hypothetical protein